MAQLPLNKFLTKTVVLSTSTTTSVYTAPIGVTAIILMAQVSNLTNETQNVSFMHYRYRTVLADSQGFGRQEGLTSSYLVKDFGIPAKDAGTPLSGKLVIESLDSVRAYADVDGSLQLVLSVLETANS